MHGIFGERERTETWLAVSQGNALVVLAFSHPCFCSKAVLLLCPTWLYLTVGFDKYESRSVSDWQHLSVLVAVEAR